MTLSETEAGVAWISNFARDDRPLAQRLLEAFVLDSWTHARAELLDLLRAEIGSAAGPVWVLPVMDDGDIRRANHLGKSESLTAFDNFEPGMSIPSMPGSEGLIGHVLRDVQGEGVFAPTAKLSLLRSKRVRTIIVVVDTVETGGQVQKFVRSLLRNPTLKSWRSFKWIRLVAVAYAVSKEGEQALSTSTQVDTLRFVRQAPTIRSLPWASGDREAALSLCLRYGRGVDPLGFGAHAGLFGFQDRVPNTVPRIFRQRGVDWEPLFVGKSGREVPTELIRELSKSPEVAVAHDQVLEAVRQERLSMSIQKQQRNSNRDILTVLSLLRASRERADSLGIALSLTQDEVDAMLTYLEVQGWITPERDLTEAGIAELAAGKRKPRRVAHRSTATHGAHYYPGSLR